MNEHGDFASIEVHHAGENGIWRDIFVGFREVPTARTFRRAFESEMVAYASDVLGLSEDGWVAPQAEVYLKAIKPIKAVGFKGWRPDDSSSDESEITLYLDGQQKAVFSIPGGKFEIKQDVNIRQGQIFRLKLNCDTIEDAPGDSRDLSFVLDMVFIDDKSATRDFFTIIKGPQL